MTKTSPYGSVSDTVDRLRKSVREKGLEVFALIDDGSAATRIGLTMQEAEVPVS